MVLSFKCMILLFSWKKNIFFSLNYEQKQKQKSWLFFPLSRSRRRKTIDNLSCPKRRFWDSLDYLWTKKIWKKIILSFFLLFLWNFFSSSFSYALPFFFSFSNDWQSSLFSSLLRLFSLLDPNYFFDWIFSNSLFALIFLFLLVGNLCFRWKDLEKKFLAKEIIYEEGSWYGGQIWQKPRVIQKNDQSICHQKITPVVQRIQRTLLTLFSLVFVVFLLNSIV